MHLSQILPQLFVGSCPARADDINHLQNRLRHHGHPESANRPRLRLLGLGLGADRGALPAVADRGAADPHPRF